jgi:hypothetical protein
MAATTGLEPATSAVTEHLDSEFQGLTSTGRNSKPPWGTRGNAYCSRTVPANQASDSEPKITRTDWPRRKAAAAKIKVIPSCRLRWYDGVFSRSLDNAGQVSNRFKNYLGASGVHSLCGPLPLVSA